MYKLLKDQLQSQQLCYFTHHSTSKAVVLMQLGAIFVPSKELKKKRNKRMFLIKHCILVKTEYESTLSRVTS